MSSVMGSINSLIIVNTIFHKFGNCSTGNNGFNTPSARFKTVHSRILYLKYMAQSQA